MIKRAGKKTLGRPVRTQRLGRPRVENPELQRFVDAVAETVEQLKGQRGDLLDAGVTWRDLVQVGIAKLRDQSVRAGGRPPAEAFAPGGEVPDLSVPPAVTGLKAIGAFAIIQLEWDILRYRNHSHVEVWRADVDDLGKALLIGTAPGRLYVDAVGHDRPVYYWARAVARGSPGVQGPFSAVRGVRGQAARDAAYLKELLAGQIDESMLYQGLRERIENLNPGESVLPEALMWLALAAEHSRTDDGRRIAQAEFLVGTAVDEVRAEAQARLLLAAKVDENSAVVQQTQQALASETEARAQAVQTLQTQVGENRAAVEAQALSIDGLRAQYTLKVDANGRVAGIGLAADEGASEIVLMADRFFLVRPDAPDGTPGLAPFIATQIDGEEVIALNADVQINGSLSVANLRTGMLPQDTQILVGNGAVVIDGQGAIRISEPGDDGTSDYLYMSRGTLEMYKYLGGAHRLYKALTRVETGVAESGSTVTLPGYWAREPRVQVSINTLRSYDPAYGNQNQTWSCRAENLRQVADGRWAFDAVARLELGDASGTAPVNQTSGDTSSNSYTSATYQTPANTTSVVVSVRLRSTRGTGTSGSYYHRRVRWRVGYATAADGAYTWTSYQTKALGATFDFVSDSRAVDLPSSQSWFLRVEYLAEDAGGTFSSGGTEYEYSTAIREASGSVSADIGSGSDHISLDMGSYSPPSGWSITNVNFSGEYAYYVAGDAPFGSATVSGGFGNSSGFYQSAGSGSQYGSFALSNWAPFSRTHGSYYRYAEAWLSVQNGGHAKVALRNAKATITLRRPMPNSTTPSNEFEFSQYSYTLSAAQLLADGSVNWIAVGE